MKRPTLLSKLALSLLMLSFPAAAQAQFSTQTNNGTITITKYTGSSAAVAIPTNITGLTVTSIGDNAFYFNTTVTSVVIPDTVISIGNNTFQYCENLASVALPNTLLSIGQNAFQQCALSNVAIPASVTNIGTEAFYNCANLSAINVDPSNPAYTSVDGILFDKYQSEIFQYPTAKSGNSYIFPGRLRPSVPVPFLVRF